MNKSAIFLAASPSVGPAIITVLGVNIPIAAFMLSFIALLLARSVAKPSKRSLSKLQDICVTGALAILLFTIVTGEMLIPAPGVGMSVVWGLGLGLSGLLVIEMCAEFVVKFFAAFLNAFKGTTPD